MHAGILSWIQPGLLFCTWFVFCLKCLWMLFSTRLSVFCCSNWWNFFTKLNGLSFDCKMLQGYVLYEVEDIGNEMSCKTDWTWWIPLSDLLFTVNCNVCWKVAVLECWIKLSPLNIITKHLNCTQIIYYMLCIFKYKK
jgi:hypothetical protein